MKKAVSIALVHNEKVLFQKRDNKPRINHPSYWGLPGGMVEKGETPKLALIRECKEETGYNLRNPNLLKAGPYKFNGNNVMVYIFYEEYDSKQVINCYEGQKMVFKTPDKLKGKKIALDHDKLAKQAVKLVRLSKTHPRGRQTHVGAVKRPRVYLDKKQYEKSCINTKTTNTRI